MRNALFFFGLVILCAVNGILTAKLGYSWLFVSFISGFLYGWFFDEAFDYFSIKEKP